VDATVASSPRPPARPAATGPPAPLPVAEVLKRATPAAAQVTCQGKSGTGFFVDRDRLLTNAHVVCGEKVGVQITTGDGRSLLGRVIASDDWLDWAVVRVPGAGIAQPLLLGDPTTLAAADPVLIIGAPKGLAGTVHEGKVSYVGRNLQGVAYLQVNADVNPGNSGGPLLDGQGRVVGIVSLKITGAEGLGMALPVEYARPALDGLPPLDEGAAARFTELRRRVEAEDAVEVARMRDDLARPVLLDVLATGPWSLALVVMQRWPGRPGTAEVAVEVHHDGQVLCQPSAKVTEWVDWQQRMRELSDPKVERRLAWLLRHGLLTDVHAGVGEAALDGCPTTIPPGARLKLVGTEGDTAWTRFPVLPTGGMRRDWRRSPGQFREASQRHQLHEGEWRSAFAQAKAQVREHAYWCDQMKRELSSPRDTRAYAEAQRRLPEEERALKAAQAELDDLERRASFAGVPREWR
jgi:hypothetical protein